MRHTTSAGTVFFIAILACYLHTRGGVTATSDEPQIKSEDSNPQVSVAFWVGRGRKYVVRLTKIVCDLPQQSGSDREKGVTLIKYSKFYAKLLLDCK